MKYEYAGERFRTKGAVRDRAREILYRYKPGVPLVGQDLLFVGALLSHHPRAEVKIGVGVAAITVEWNPVHANNKGFWITRIDGTKTDFSFYECITPTPYAMKVKSALRAAVSDQTQEFRARSYAAEHNPNMGFICPILGGRTLYSEAHVDHAPPLTFDRLVADFLDDYGCSIKEVKVIDSQDGQIGDSLADKLLLMTWRDYHAKKAVLRMVSWLGNLKQPKERVEYA